MEATELNNLRRKVLYRSWHRGCKETDRILGRFADSCVQEMTPAEVALYQSFLDLPDHDIYAFVAGRKSPPEEYEALVCSILNSLKYIDA